MGHHCKGFEVRFCKFWWSSSAAALCLQCCFVVLERERVVLKVNDLGVAGKFMTQNETQRGISILSACPQKKRHSNWRPDIEFQPNCVKDKRIAFLRVSYIFYIRKRLSTVPWYSHAQYGLCVYKELSCDNVN